jgi:predicted anti-sigma-YlaC factor YlaD
MAWYMREDASEHMDEQDHWEKEHKCEACRQSFHSRAEAKQHMYQQDHWRTYRCKPCNKGFESESNMRQVCMRNKRSFSGHG